MANFRFHQISNTKKIRYISKIFKNSSFIVFLHGFMSDLEGKKPNAFLQFAKKNKISFLALEYSGHGKSSGKFVNGNIFTTPVIKSLVIGMYPLDMSPKDIDDIVAVELVTAPVIVSLA